VNNPSGAVTEYERETTGKTLLSDINNYSTWPTDISGDDTWTGYEMSIYMDYTDFYQDLIAYWPFEEGSGTVTNDASGNNHNGTLGGSTYSTDKKVGNYSMNFEGVNDYVDAGNIDLGSQFTISFWGKTTDSYGFFITNKSDGNSNGFAVRFNENYIIFHSRNGSVSDESRGGGVYINHNQWFHCAVVANRTAGIANIYINGTEATTFDSSICTDFITNQTINLGKMINSGQDRLYGKMDEVRIYNRCLGSSEIAYLASPLKSAVRDEPELRSDIISETVLYPNPFDNELTIENTKSVLRVDVFNTLGMHVLNIMNSENPKIVLNTGNLKSGYYIVRVIDNAGKITTFKTFKE
jgi:hypothetical protein